MEDEEGINPTLRTRYFDQPEGNTGWIRDLPVIQREAKRRFEDPDWEPYLPKNKSYKEGRRYDGDKRKFDQEERPMSKIARGEQDYWRGQKRILQEELEEDGGPLKG